MNKQEQKNKPKPPDAMLRIKHIAYCRSQTPVSDMDFKDLVNYARHQLCVVTNRLFKDPIWDEYTSEEILVEWFSHQFEKDPNFVKEFELGLAKGEILDFSGWADLQMKKELEAKEQRLKDLEDKVTFSPDDVMGEQ